MIKHVGLVISVCLSSLPVAHLSDAPFPPPPPPPPKTVIVTGDSAKIHDETTESSAWFFNELGV